MNFTEEVYELCKKIHEGKISTYKDIAVALNSKAYRAVGTALNKNKSKEVPCHRVIKSSGEIGGFARGNFSLESTLRYGTPIFYDSLTTEEKPWLRGTTYGFHGSNVLILDNNISDEGKNHEIIHSLQAQTYRNLSSILPAPYSKIENFLLRNPKFSALIPVRN